MPDLALVLALVAGFFWLVALTLPIYLLAVIGNLPGGGP